MSDIVVEIRGGTLVAAYSSKKTDRIFVIDWDNSESPSIEAKAQKISMSDLRYLPTETANALANLKS